MITIIAIIAIFAGSTCAADLQLPTLHYAAPAGVILSDPMPFIDTQTGLAHLFFICTNASNATAYPTWCHARGSSLVNLKSEAGPLFTGPESAGNVLRLNATHVGMAFGTPQGVQVAVSTDASLDGGWSLQSANLPALPSGFSFLGNPFVRRARDGPGFQMVVSSCTNGPWNSSEAHPAAVLFSSVDFLTWELVGPLFESTQPLGCAEAISWQTVGGREVLLFSTTVPRPATTAVWWFVGDISAAGVFLPTANGTVDGGVIFSVGTTVDDLGNIVAMGWVPEDRSTVAGTWAGVSTFPRTLILSPAGTVGFVPAPDTSFFRNTGDSCANVPVAVGTDRPGGDFAQIDVSTEADPVSACQNECCSNPECVAWVLAKPQPSAAPPCAQNGACCWLKNTLTATNPAAECTSAPAKGSAQVFDFGALSLDANESSYAFNLGALANQLELDLSGLSISPAAGLTGPMFQLTIRESSDGQEFTNLNFEAAAACTDGALLPHTDMSYDNVDDVQMHNATASDCQALCCQRDDCFAFTFADPQPVLLAVPPSLHHLGDGCVSGAQCCWIKGAGAYAVPGCIECTSGFKATGSFNLVVDRSRSSLDPSAANTPVMVGTVAGDISIFIDNSIVEVYSSGNGGSGQTAATFRIYPTYANATKIELKSINASVVVSAIAFGLAPV